jgi:hypothetical protein
MGDKYPHDGPLASRRAPRHTERRHLFLANGQPTITPSQRALLEAAETHLRNIDIATGLLADAIRNDNPKVCATAIKSLTANSEFLTGYVNDAETAA